MGVIWCICEAVAGSVYLGKIFPVVRLRAENGHFHGGFPAVGVDVVVGEVLG